MAYAAIFNEIPKNKDLHLKICAVSDSKLHPSDRCLFS